MARGVQIIWTPWRDQQELLGVRSWLFPDSFRVGEDENGLKEGKRRACDQISAWTLRSHLPHAVESTWLLTESILADCSSSSHFSIKAGYITAISRFVTGLLDIEQDSKYKVSMYTKAAQIDLPASFVDLRHEATHGDLPNLGTLREKANEAVLWLWKEYWVGLEEAEGGKENLDVRGSGVGDEGVEREREPEEEKEEEVEAWGKVRRWKGRPIGVP